MKDGAAQIATQTIADTDRASEPGVVPPTLSVVAPVYNEEESVELLYQKLDETLSTLPNAFEIIVVNDGSTDGSLARLRQIAERHPELKIINLRRNYGQTAAIMAGIDHASGEIIITIDADLQNDPQDIPELLDKVAEGYDVVSGWRKNRQDSPIRRTFVSRVANAIISRISGVRLHDYGCTLKAYRREVIKDVRLYGEMHRFIPIYATWMGAKVVELPVRHHPRRAGHSKYGLERTVKVILDLAVVKFLDRHFVKPIYVFGGVGLIAIGLSFLFTLWMFYLKFIEGTSFILTPLPLLIVMTFLTGVLSLLMGLLAEMLLRTYFEAQQRPAYLVRDLVNFDGPS